MQRESLDIAVSQGAVIEARVSNGVSDVIVFLMSDDHTRDVQAPQLPTDGSWATITAAADSVVFVRSKVWNTAPQIEYRVVHGAEHAVPTYRHGDDATAFVSAWTAGSSPFALIVDETFTMLVPRLDLPKVSDMSWSAFADLDDVITHYRDTFSKFNHWLGVDDADPNPVHHELPGAYMVRPDRSGPGLAYYGPHNAVGTNNASVSYYLEGPSSWLILHEIGHGYDGMMTGGSGAGEMALGEVWNNVYAYLYQTTELGMTESNWLYRNVNKVNDQRLKDQARHSAGGLDFNSVGVDVRLDFLVRIAELTGTDGFRYFNRSLRDVRSEPDFISWPSRNDLVAKHWGLEQGHDLLPWFEQWNLPVSASLTRQIRDVAQLPIALPLGDYFSSHAEAVTAATALGLGSPGEMVSTPDLAALGTSGNLVVAANIADTAGIERGVATLWAGEQQVAEASFSNGSADFGTLPIGAYTLRLPQDRNTGVVPSSDWVMVKAGESLTSTIEYSSTPTAPVNGSRITLQGLGNAPFATITHDPAEGSLTVTDNRGAPHVYFTDEYAHLTISDGAVELLDRGFIGNAGRNVPGTVSVPAAIGTTITLMHREWTSRVVETDPATGSAKPSLNATSQYTTYEVTALGLAKVGDDAAEDFTASLAQRLQEVEQVFTDNRTARLEADAAGLLHAISLVPDATQRTSLESDHGPLLAGLLAPAQEQFPAELALSLTRTDGLGADVAVGDVVRFRIDYTNTTNSTFTAFPRASNLAGVLTSFTQNCRWMNLGSDTSKNCGFANHTVTTADLAAGWFTPQVTFDATDDGAGTQVRHGGFTATGQPIRIGG